MHYSPIGRRRWRRGTQPSPIMRRLWIRSAARAAQLAKKLAVVELKQSQLTEKLKLAELELAQLKKQLFGKRSEKVDPAQLLLAFDEACAEAAAHEPLEDEPYPGAELEKLATQENEDTEEGGEEEAPPKATQHQDPLRPRGRPRRRDPPARRGADVRVRLREGPHGGGVFAQARGSSRSASSGAKRCGSSTPAQGAERSPVRRCRPEPIEKGLAGPSLLAEVLISKYADHLPLNRLEGIFARDGVVLAKSTLGSWVEASAGLLEPVADEVGRAVVSRLLVQTDETGILVLDREHPDGRFKGRMWVYCGAKGELFYEYTPTKETRWPKARLAEFKGILQADAYPGFDALFRPGSGILEAGCNAREGTNECTRASERMHESERAKERANARDRTNASEQVNERTNERTQANERTRASERASEHTRASERTRANARERASERESERTHARTRVNVRERAYACERASERTHASEQASERTHASERTRANARERTHARTRTRAHERASTRERTRERVHASARESECTRAHERASARERTRERVHASARESECTRAHERASARERT